MARRRAAQKRDILPDPKYGDKVVMKLINNVMQCGKKSIAERIVYGAFTIMESKTSEDPLKSFKEALDNTKPLMEVRSRRVGGATYQIPIEVRSERAQARALSWLIEAASSRSEHTMVERLAGELMDAAHGRGAAVKKREDTHKMAEANRAFAHYRW